MEHTVIEHRSSRCGDEPSKAPTRKRGRRGASSIANATLGTSARLSESAASLRRTRGMLRLWIYPSHLSSTTAVSLYLINLLLYCRDSSRTQHLISFDGELSINLCIHFDPVFLAIDVDGAWHKSSCQGSMFIDTADHSLATDQSVTHPYSYVQERTDGPILNREKVQFCFALESRPTETKLQSRSMIEPGILLHFDCPSALDSHACRPTFSYGKIGGRFVVRTCPVRHVPALQCLLAQQKGDSEELAGACG